MRPVKVLDVLTLKERDNRPILEMSVDEMNEADEQPIDDSSWDGYTADEFDSANRIELHMDYYDDAGIFGPEGDRVRIVDGREAEWDPTTESVSIQLNRDDTPLSGEYYFEWVLVFDPEATDGTVPTSDTADEVSTVPSLGFYEISVEKPTVRDLESVEALDRTVGTLTVNRLTGPDGAPIELGSGLDARRTDVTGISDPVNNLDASNAQYVSSSINTHRQNAVHDQRQPAVPSSLDGEALGQSTPLSSTEALQTTTLGENYGSGFPHNGLEQWYRIGTVTDGNTSVHCLVTESSRTGGRNGEPGYEIVHYRIGNNETTYGGTHVEFGDPSDRTRESEAKIVYNSTAVEWELYYKIAPYQTADLHVYPDTYSTDDFTYEWERIGQTEPTGDTEYTLDRHHNIIADLVQTDGDIVVGGTAEIPLGVINGPRGAPTTSELDSGERMTYVSDGTDGYAEGDMVSARNNAGTIQDQVIVAAANDT